MRWLAAAACLAAGPAFSACESITFEAAPYTVCPVDPAADDVRLWLRDTDGAILGTFDRLDAALGAEDLSLGIAMNGGMYHQDRRPVGLFVEEGREIAPLVTRDGPGNFGLLPNGVLCLTSSSAAILETGAYAETRPACRFATQSGPMLVIDGALHPRFIPDGTSLNIRNGAGVAPDGTLWLAISDAPVNFHDFARLFRDRLGTPNALYLDGRVSRLFARDLGRHDIGFPIGPILGIAVPRD